MNRRELFKAGGLAAGSFLISGSVLARPKSAAHQFKFCLNTSTIRGQKLGLRKEIETAAQAGYDGIEIWLRDVQQFIQDGGAAADIRAIAADNNISIESAIGFPRWIVDDETERKKALEEAKQEMALLAEIGCLRMAAPPVGATAEPMLDLLAVAERYRALLDLGEQMGVIPQLELWGFSANLHRIGEALFVAAESGHPHACLLLDVFHIYKGGSDFNALKTISGNSLQMFHMSDYPAEPGRDAAKDGDRVYPGDGVAPFKQILTDLHAKNGPVILSLELFRQDLWEKETLAVAKTGLEKMQNVVAQAIG